MLKLGGALITHKQRREAVRWPVLRRLADELAAWQVAATDRLVLAHGSGSFAHVAVRDSQLLERPDDPRAAAQVAAAAARLNHHVVAALLAAGMAPVPVPGSVLATCRDGVVVAVRSDIVQGMLAAGWLPVVYGDVAPDSTRGAAVASTEPLLAALATALCPRRLVLATDVDGVFDADPHAQPAARPLPVISAAGAAELAGALGQARTGSTDVTGGMASKVAGMLALAERQPGLELRIVSGLRPGAVPSALSGRPDAGGTRLIGGADGSAHGEGLSSGVMSDLQ
jgi:isopentenyl phosphate kinase